MLARLRCLRTCLPNASVKNFRLGSRLSPCFCRLLDMGPVHSPKLAAVLHTRTVRLWVRYSSEVHFAKSLQKDPTTLRSQLRDGSVSYRHQALLHISHVSRVARHTQLRFRERLEVAESRSNIFAPIRGSWTLNSQGAETQALGSLTSQGGKCPALALLFGFEMRGCPANGHPGIWGLGEITVWPLRLLRIGGSGP